MARVVTCGCACHRSAEAVNLAQAEYAAKRRARTFPMLAAFRAEMARIEAADAEARMAPDERACQQDRQIAEGVF